MSEERNEEIEELWQVEHSAHPNMAKETFVRNNLFSQGIRPSDLGAWILTQEDLHDQIWEGGCDGYFRMIETPAEDGKTMYRADPDGPRVIVRIYMETLHSGESNLLKRERPWHSWED